MSKGLSTYPTMSDSQKETSNSPCKRFIYSDQDMQEFLRSPAKKNLLSFAKALGQACSSKEYDYDPNQPLRNLNPGMASLHGSLKAMETTWWFDDDDTKNTNQSGQQHNNIMIARRFGDPMFRKWHSELLVKKSNAIVDSILDCHVEFFDRYNDVSATSEESKRELEEMCSKRGYEAAEKKSDTTTENDAVIIETGNVDQKAKMRSELVAYLDSAFGHPIRLDYGTGHESSFLIFLYALYQAGPVAGNMFQTSSSPSQANQKEALAPVALSIFSQYLKVTRKLQTIYMLEPAGSHGVWGLDDYHCLPFYFGALQLIHKREEQGDDHLSSLLLKPSCIHDRTLLEDSKYIQKYMYLGCINYILSLKKNVPFFESSPMLNDISMTVPTWDKVSSGLLKLYEGEVLSKKPVVQHFVFGPKYFRATWETDGITPVAPKRTFMPLSTNNSLRGVPDVGGIPPTRAPWAK